jgi:hypothetical protein
VCSRKGKGIYLIFDFVFGERLERLVRMLMTKTGRVFGFTTTRSAVSFNAETEGSGRWTRRRRRRGTTFTEIRLNDSAIGASITFNELDVGREKRRGMLEDETLFFQTLSLLVEKLLSEKGFVKRWE